MRGEYVVGDGAVAPAGMVGGEREDSDERTPPSNALSGLSS